MKYFKIRHDRAKAPRYELVDLPEDVHEWLEACYKEIDCDCIETASTLLPPLVLILDESGKCKSDWRKKLNTPASILYGNPFDDIVGDVLIGKIAGEDIIGIDENDVLRLLKYLP